MDSVLCVGFSHCTAQHSERWRTRCWKSSIRKCKEGGGTFQSRGMACCIPYLKRVNPQACFPGILLYLHVNGNLGSTGRVLNATAPMTRRLGKGPFPPRAKAVAFACGSSPKIRMTQATRFIRLDCQFRNGPHRCRAFRKRVRSCAMAPIRLRGPCHKSRSRRPAPRTGTQDRHPEQAPVE